MIVVCVHIPSCGIFQPGLFGGARKSKKAAANPGKNKRLNINVAKRFLATVCSVKNERNLKPDGPYGDICNLIAGLANSKANRKRLQTYWFRLKKSLQAGGCCMLLFSLLNEVRWSCCTTLEVGGGIIKMLMFYVKFLKAHSI